MSAGLVPETILIMLLALIGDREWKKVGRCLCLDLQKKPLKSLILREFKVLFNDSLTVVLFHRAVHYTVENSTMSGPKG